MKFRYYIFLLIGMMLSLSLSAQQIILQGKVSDAYSGKGLQGVVVTIRPEGGNRILKFAKTQVDGGFQLKLSVMPEGKNVLHFSMMGYATKTMPLEDGKTEYDVLLTEQATKLKEVTVKAPSIRQRGDTIGYNVASFADANDKSLADVLKKMPGMEVSDNGEIKYNGKAINKFYIEGHDMLGGRYSIATNNIHQKDVGTVEVMTNHQPIKALEGMSFSEDPAINIKLKESAKNRLVGTVKVGGGMEDALFSDSKRESKLNVWEGEMSLMRFSKKMQSLNTFKSNNIGTNVTRDGELLFSDGGSGLMGNNYSLKDYVSVTPDRLTGISDERVRKNQTHAFTTNNLWALGKNTDLTSQIVYTHDRLVSSSIGRTQYFLNDSTILNLEDEYAKQKHNKLAADFTLTSNSEKSYITNRLSTNLAWNDVMMDISGTYPNHQQGKMPRYQVSDKFELLRRSGERAFSFSTYNGYLVNPQSLALTRSADTSSLTNSSTDEAYQSVRSAAFFSHTYTSLGFYLKPFTVTMKVGLQVLNRTMKSHLDGISWKEDGDDASGQQQQGVLADMGMLRNDMSMTYMRVYASPEAEFNQGGWHIRFQIPIAYTPYYYRNRLGDDANHSSKNVSSDDLKHDAYKAQVSPQLSVSYYLTPRLQATLSGGISQREVDEQNFYQGLILCDYRNLYRGYVDFTMDKTQNVAFNLNYKRPLASLFANAYVRKSWADRHLTMARDFVGDYILNSYLASKSKSEQLMAGGRVSKGLGFMHGLVSVGFDYLQMKGTLHQNETPSRYSTDNYMLSAKWSGRPIEWLNFTYELNWDKDEMRLRDTDFKTSSTSLSQHLTCNLHLLKPWFIKLHGEYERNQIAEGQYKNLFLADASTSYSFKGGVELSLTALNLFNQHTYSYTVYSSLTRMDKEYQLRGRTVMASVFFHF